MKVIIITEYGSHLLIDAESWDDVLREAYDHGHDNLVGIIRIPEDDE